MICFGVDESHVGLWDRNADANIRQWLPFLVCHAATDNCGGESGWVSLLTILAGLIRSFGERREKRRGEKPQE
jgi:hypothetical protein